MELRDYQLGTREYANYPKEVGLFYNMMEISAKNGEMCDKINEMLMSGDGEMTRERAMKIGISLGDLLFAITNLATDLGLTLDEIVALNLRKLTMLQERSNKESNQKPKRVEFNNTSTK